MQEIRERRGDRWHVGKEIPLAIIFAIAVQTMGGVWFAATYVAKIDTLSTMVAELRASLYTKEDALRDKEMYAARVDDIARRVAELERAWRPRQPEGR